MSGKNLIKQLGVIGISSLLVAANLCASEIQTKSRIASVCVYPDSALLTRTAELHLNAGRYKIIFDDIIPEIDENSLRVSVSEGRAGVKLFGARLKREYLEEPASVKIKQLKSKIQELEDEVKVLRDDKELLSKEREFLESIRLFSRDQLPKDLITKMPAPQELGEIFNFLDTKFRENYSKVRDIDLRLRDLTNKIEVSNRELSRISGSAGKLKRSIVAEVMVLEPGDFFLSISYLVNGASWQPIYDARASLKKSEVELISYGIVTQSTGEEWQDVELSLSTAKPAIGGRMPYVSPWFLRPYHPPANKKTRIKDVLSQSMAFDEGEEEFVAKSKTSEIEYARPEEKGIAVVYKLSQETTIKSDGSEHKLPISSQALKARFEYSTYPRASAFAYLGSRVKNRKDLQLLAGRVNIFLEEDFVGRSDIDNIGPGEEFDLYLGVDESVKVKRQKIEEKVDNVLIAGIPSPNKKTTSKYKLTVENYKSRPIKVILFEAMPVPADERIKVKMKGIDFEPKEKDWKDRKGIWRWEMELEQGEKKEIFYTFIIEHPLKMIVGE
ncbi:mucoidy inhibitor MuiA family protein [bacterium]|nr:mucoidy inhibitor MuiA family protein [bacterium]